MKISADDGASSTKDILLKYSSLKISAADAMSLLDLQCLENLMIMTIEAGLPLPHLEVKAARSMANKFLKATSIKGESINA